MGLKKFLVAMVFVVISFTPIFGQSVQEKSFKKAVDYVNCKTIEYSLKSNSEMQTKFQKVCPCQDGTGYTKIDSFFSGNKNFQATLNLAVEIESLKNGFKKNWDIKEVAEFLTVTVFNDPNKYPKLYKFSDKRKNDIAGFKNVLHGELLPILSDTTSYSGLDIKGQEAAANLKDSDANHNSDPNHFNGKDKNWFGGLTFQIDIFSIIIAVLIAFLLIKFIKSGHYVAESDVSNKIKNYVNEKIYEAQIDSGNSGISSLEVGKLKEEIKNLKAEINQLNLKIDGAKIPMEVILPKYQEDSWPEIKQPDLKFETFFLSTPNSDGSFNESSASSVYKEGASIYRFTKVSFNKARFQIDERESSIKLALQYPDKNIDPVCDAMNAFNPKAKRISTKESGEAELQEGKWVKNTKAKIIYEG